MATSLQQPDAWVVLAHLLRPQGRKGEILADLLTDFPERFSDRKGLSLRRPDGSQQPVSVESHWIPVGRNAGRVVLKFEGVNTIEAAEAFKSCDLIVSHEQRLALPDQDSDDEANAQYISDLLGCTVLDHGRIVGTIQDVQFPTNSSGARLDDAAPLLVLESATGDELLIPFVSAWIDPANPIDVVNKRLSMLLPEGLLDINVPVQNRKLTPDETIG